MNTVKKSLIVLSVTLMATGLLVMMSMLFVLGMDLTALNVTAKEVKNVFTAEGPIKEVAITTSADVQIVRGDVERVQIECTDSVKKQHEIRFENGKLTVVEKDLLKWYDVFFKTPKNKITVVLPDGEYEGVTVMNTSGGVYLEKFKTNRLTVTTGKGNVIFEKVAANDAQIRTDEGAVKGGFAGEMRFDASSDGGKVSVPATTEGGTCVIRTVSGDIEIEAPNRNE